MENKELEKLRHDLRGPLTIVQSFFDEMESSKLNKVFTENQGELFTLAKRALERSFLYLKDV